LTGIDRETNYDYFAEVPKNTQCWLVEPETYIPQPSGRGRPGTNRRRAPTAPAAQTVAALATQLATAAWQTHALRQATKGFLIAQVAAIRVYPSRAGLPGNSCWLVVRRNPDDPTDIHYFLSRPPGPRPADTALDELVYACAMRWPRPGGTRIIFEQAKQRLGLNQYETRTCLWLSGTDTSHFQNRRPSAYFASGRRFIESRFTQTRFRR